MYDGNTYVQLMYDVAAKWNTCGHALACCKDDKLDPEDLVHSCCIVETYLKAYGSNVVPPRRKEHWEILNGIVVHPTIIHKDHWEAKKE
jgi:hypothetical protein